MAHGGQKITFGLIGRFGLAGGLLQTLFGLYAFGDILFDGDKMGDFSRLFK